MENPKITWIRVPVPAIWETSICNLHCHYCNLDSNRYPLKMCDILESIRCTSVIQSMGKSTKPSANLKRPTKNELGTKNMYPLVNKQFAIENGPFSSLIYPLKIVIFHSFLYVYQRVND